MTHKTIRLAKITLTRARIHPRPAMSHYAASGIVSSVNIVSTVAPVRRHRARRASTARTHAVVRDDVASTSSSGLHEMKKELLAVAAASARGGAVTSEAQKQEMQTLARAMAGMNPSPQPVFDAKHNGEWELVYSSSFAFRSSPFFWAVGKLLGPQADFFYSAHDHQTGMFGGGCGKCVQRINVSDEASEIESDVVVKASIGVPLLGFAPLISGYGSVITKGTAKAITEDTIAVSLGSLTTTVRQDDANVLPALNFLNGTTVPVGDVMGRISDASSQVLMRTVYLDDDLRISELEDATLLIYRRANM